MENKRAFNLIVFCLISCFTTSFADDKNVPSSSIKTIGKAPKADSVRFEDLGAKGWMIWGYSKGKAVYTVHKIGKGVQAYEVTPNGNVPVELQDTIFFHKIKQ